jgi:hypothetical protein
MTSTSRYALVALDANQPEPPKTLAIGPLADVTALIPGSLAQARLRADAAEMLQFARDSVGQIRRQAATLGELKAAHRLDMMVAMCTELDKLSARMDYFLTRQEARALKARQDAARAELCSALDALGRGALPEPSLPTPGDADTAIRDDPPDPDLEAPNEDPDDYSLHGYDSVEA